MLKYFYISINKCIEAINVCLFSAAMWAETFIMWNYSGDMTRHDTAACLFVCQFKTYFTSNTPGH